MTEKIQYEVIKNGKEYDCGEIGISTEKWYSLLKEPKARQYIDVLATFLREPEHKASCYAVAQKNDGDSKSYSAKVWHFGKWTNAQIGNFTVLGTDNNPTYWAIPMRFGWETKDGFAWQMRDELVEALRMYLLDSILVGFKKHYEENPYSVSEELYKWELLQNTSGKSNVEIAESLIGKNIVDNPRVDMVLKYLLSKKPNELNIIIGDLFKEEIELNERILSFKTAMRDVCPADWRNCANDERTASAFLACKYPDKYTFYMYKVYDAVCSYLGIKEQKTGFIYSHFLKIVYGITQKYGEAVQSIISGELTSFELKPQSLAVQTMFWVMHDELKKENSITEQPMTESYLQSYIDLLKANHNIIFNGAPGTGKTYLARQIALAMNPEEEPGFVQFHPSYDYSDFIEGLRPVRDEKGSIGFERKDGVFKTFCKKALQNLIDAKKSIIDIQEEMDINDRLDNFVTNAIENDIEMKTTSTKNKFFITDQNEKSIYISAPDNKNVKEVVVPKSDIINLFLAKKKVTQVCDIKKFFGRNYGTQADSYTCVIYNMIKSEKNVVVRDNVHTVTKKDFVFIIDEINRGEISKIFGELFYSIDPGYRGSKGKVQTQYQNLVDGDDAFKDGFYVPENVYIIGTMNDIDRSVESMDFAMRRRFTWQEITAEASAQNMGIDGELLKRMKNLNDVILETEGLGSSYQVGAAMFLKVKDGDLTEEQLWKLNLKSLMKEYLRGLPQADETLDKMKKAYFLESDVEESDNGKEYTSGE